MAFPSPVGGTLIREDLVPSIVFATLYGFLVLLATFRLFRRSSRTTLLIGTGAFSVERVVIFSLRAIQSRNQAKAESHGLATYEQLTIGMGYIGICNDLINFLRVLLVNTTHPDTKQGTRVFKLAADRPRARFWYRRLSDFLHLAFWAAIAPGIISGSKYSNGIDNPDVARRVMRLRYASTGVALFLTAATGIIAYVAVRKVRRTRTSAGHLLMTLNFLLSIVAIYRLSVMHNTTESLLSRGPGSLSSPSAKALFYIFHILPEWLSSAILLGPNVRKIFGSGPFGDWRGADPKQPKEGEGPGDTHSDQELASVQVRDNSH